MVASHICPLCTERYDEVGHLRVHLEVEHRKSELARFAVEAGRRGSDRPVEERHPTPPV